MRGGRDIPDAVRRRQADASDPAAAVFVAANAGSGKTHVLAQRVIRLMLDGTGVDPSKILCITFTKAAAANMAARVYDTLKDWIALDDGALDEAMRDIGVADIDAAKRRRARRLFAAALEVPGGLKVQTIHAFCTRILQQFPFEADVAARFTVLEERAQAEMLERATLAVLLEAAGAPDSPLGRALKRAVAAAADTTVLEVVREAVGQRDKLLEWIDAAGDVEAATAQLAAALGIAADDDLGAIAKEIVEGPHLPCWHWADAAIALEEGSQEDRKQAARLAAAAAASGEVRLHHYFSVFLTGEKKLRDRLITGGLAARYPDLHEQLTAEQPRVAALIARRNAVICRDRTAALLAIAREVIARYEAEKDRRGLLDYDDLIDRTHRLLAEVDPSWVHYKLDLGLDHVLIDEAQDTSEKQWAIVRHLTAEFAAGAGARGLIRRTVFAVGDEKQSIFSFQGAAPHQYDAMRRHFASAFSISDVDWRFVRFDHSFRSGANVLGAVDEVFRPPAIYRSITSDRDGMLAHQALPGAVPGIVEIWPLIEADDGPNIEAWDAPFDTVPETSPQVQLARKIAEGVRSAIATGEPVGRERRPMREGDVLVLVRQRGVLFEAIIRALKNAGVAVAGADRMVLTDHIAIIDLMALADALLLPQDDLALAVALKSPLFGFDDDRLFDLAYGRRASLRVALAARAEHDLFFKAADELLQRAAAKAQETPFTFFAWLLGPEQGRRRIYARLGLEAADALDEFLELALAYERSETPSLQGFLAWLRASAVPVKRDMEIARDEVRVMTVHGAKGLEAPVVILADTTTPPRGTHQPRLLELPIDSAPDASPVIVWAGRKIDDVSPVAAARQSALDEVENEHRRLLYVAMTRAAERLIVCGYEGKSARKPGCWYDLVLDGLKDKPGFAEIGDGDTRLWRYCKAPDLGGQPAPRPQPISSAQEEPAWLTAHAPAAVDRPVTLTPSTAHEETAQHRGAPRGADRGEDVARAMERGTLLHRLMQSLPDVAPSRREEAAHNYLARAAASFSAEERDRFAGQALAVLADPRFAPLFADESRAEVPIVGRLPRPGRPDFMVAGQIDRLVVTAAAVLIADYKTNRNPPHSVETAPQAYVEQLALYRALLRRIYPERPVRAALVWTDIPDLMEIPAVTLDAALVRLTAA